MSSSDSQYIEQQPAAKKSLSELPDASLLRRLAAWIYDLFLIFAVCFAYVAIVTFIAAKLGIQQDDLSLTTDGDNMTLVADSDYQPILSGPLFQAGLIGVIAIFYIGFWLKKGATLGMQTWRMHLIDLEGNRPDLKTCAIRCAAATASLGVFGLGYIWSLFDSQNRTFHDIVSKTRVVVHPKNKKK